jgi:hypothetical protein
MACSFSGDGADKQAHDLAYELRKRYKLQSYTYQGRFDPGEAQGRGFDKNGNPAKWKYNKYKDEKDKEKARHPELCEIAVLVGNFSTADEEIAQETLQKIKYARPQCLELKENQATHQTLTGWRYAQQRVYEAIGSEKKKLGPMRHAFMVPNPMLPSGFCLPKGVDPEIVALNKGVPYSLLDCPGKYTVQVATFRGNGVIKQDDIRDIEDGRKKMGTRLATAAQNADKMTHRLRELGYDAYQFHDRYTSTVTIGTFNSPGMTRPDGQIELDPKIRRTIEVFGAKSDRASLMYFRQRKIANPNNPLNFDDPLQEAKYQSLIQAQGLDRQSVAVEPEFLDISKDEFIPFDPKPTVVQVPKRSFSMSMNARD